MKQIVPAEQSGRRHTGPAPPSGLCGPVSAPPRPKVRDTGSHTTTKADHTLINLQQDADGYIRMNRHFPEKVRIAVTFADGTTEELSGGRLNKAYDAALAEYRAQNHLDARGYSRSPKKKTSSGNKIEFVPVHPGMGD
ncbi:hypothetical protein Arth_1062 [Arthrobacter sp. FB24]|nr:hypothetical protein Arth_1062 [Arthrobacter sp. FB24]